MRQIKKKEKKNYSICRNSLAGALQIGHFAGGRSQRCFARANEHVSKKFKNNYDVIMSILKEKVMNTYFVIDKNIKNKKVTIMEGNKNAIALAIKCEILKESLKSIYKFISS